MLGKSIAATLLSICVNGWQSLLLVFYAATTWLGGCNIANTKPVPHQALWSS